MFLDAFKPAITGPALQYLASLPIDGEPRQIVPMLPVNLTAAEIRAMVLEVLG